MFHIASLEGVVSGQALMEHELTGLVPELCRCAGSTFCMLSIVLSDCTFQHWLLFYFYSVTMEMFYFHFRFFHHTQRTNKRPVWLLSPPYSRRRSE